MLTGSYTTAVMFANATLVWDPSPQTRGNEHELGVGSPMKRDGDFLVSSWRCSLTSFQAALVLLWGKSSRDWAEESALACLQDAL